MKLLKAIFDFFFDKEEKIENEYEQRKQLIEKLRALLKNFQETGGLPGSYNCFHKGVLDAIEKSKLERFIQTKTLIHFKYARNIPEAQYLCSEFIVELLDGKVK